MAGLVQSLGRRRLFARAGLLSERPLPRRDKPISGRPGDERQRIG
jgi:hypothetical protein